jgi:tetratricopeptide (TPR) repeat protein
VSLLARAAVALARSGEGDAAERMLAVAEPIARAAPAGETDIALRHIATALAELRRTNEALRLLKDISDKTQHTPVLVAVVTQEARAGNAATAHALAGTIGEAHHRAGALGPVAVAQRRAGDARAAAATLSVAVADLDRIAYPFAKSYALNRLALAQAEIAGQETDPAIRRDDLAKAVALAEQIGDDSLRAQALWTAAAVADRHGVSDLAREIEERADRATGQIKSRLDQSWMLGDIALAHARRGEKDAAKIAFRRGLDIAAGINNAWGRAR